MYRIFYQNSIAASKCLDYVKPLSSANQETCASAPRIK